MKRLLILVLAVAITEPAGVRAEVTDAEFAELREQLVALSARLEQLAAENAELRRSQEQTESAVAAATNTTSQSSASWTDRITLDGDFRYRYENIDAEGSDTRNRNRIRARANIKANVSDDIEVGFGLATGGSDPVSTNQTLGGGGSSKGVVLNLAYVDWRVNEDLHLVAGKHKNPLYKAGGQPLMWDGDWTPEGIALRYSRDWLFANAIGTFLESDTRRSNDNFSFGAQIGGKTRVGDVRLTGGIGYYSFKTAGDATTFGDPSDPGDFFGNSAVEAGGLPCGTTPGADCVYVNDYLLTQVFAEAAFDVGDWPMAVFAEHVSNSDASDNDSAWTIGARFGSASDRGDMQFTYYFAEKEADSVLGLLTDSDFGGGGTDSRGHWLQLNVGVTKNWSIGAQYFINERDLAAGSKSDYDRLMIDMQWKWK